MKFSGLGSFEPNLKPIQTTKAELSVKIVRRLVGHLPSDRILTFNKALISPLGFITK